MRFRRVHLGAVLCCLAVAGCVSAPTPAPAPSPAPAPAPAPRPQVAAPEPVPAYDNWMDAPPTPGDWAYRNGTALFSGPSGSPLLTLRCDRSAGAIEIVRTGQSGASDMIVRTETMDRSIAARPGTAGVTAQIPARDPLLDGMAFSKGRFAIEAGGLPTLYAPAYPEVTRVIEDCR